MLIISTLDVVKWMLQNEVLTCQSKPKHRQESGSRLKPSYNRIIIIKSVSD